MSILFRLILLVLIAALPLVAIEVYSAFALRQQRAAELRDEALRLAHQLNMQQDRIIEGARQLLVALSQLQAVREGERQGCASALAQVQVQFPQYNAIFLSDIEGNVVCSAGATPPATNVADGRFFTLAVETGRFVVGEYTVGRVTGRPTLHFAVPVLNQDGNLRGIIAAGLSLEWMANFLKAGPYPVDTALVVADRKGTVLVRVPDVGAVGQPLPERYHAALFGSRAGTTEMESLDGVRRVLGFVPVPVPPEDIYVGVSINAEPQLAYIDAVFHRALLLTALVALVAFTAAVWLGTHTIRRPLRQAMGTIERWMVGDYDARLNGRYTSYEFGALREKLNALAARLAERQREISEIGEARRRLLAVAGHDLRQPLQAISSFLDGLIRRPASSPNPVAVGRADRAVSRMTRALDAVADVARLERQDVKPVVQSFPVSDLLLEIEDDWAAEASKKGLRLRVRECSCLVAADREMLSTILRNLVSNAVRYTENGGVLVGCRRRGERLAVQVIDTGVGIPDSQREAVFEEFRRLMPERGNGMGLGLWIVKRTAEVLGVTIQFRSTPGRGTCFTVEVPLVTKEVAARAHAGQKPALHRLAAR